VEGGWGGVIMKEHALWHSAAGTSAMAKKHGGLRAGSAACNILCKNIKGTVFFREWQCIMVSGGEKVLCPCRCSPNMA
jgi:hypothetical protein